jgi:ClpP class serine protease
MPSGQAGSVGVLLMHVEFSKMLDDWGFKVSLLHEGKHKVDGNPFEPLPDAVKTKWQAQLKKLYDKFAGVVAENRGLSVDAVKKTEADVFDAEQLLQLGLADEIAVMDDLVPNFIESLNSPLETETPEEDEDMTTENKTDDKKASDEEKAQAATEAKKSERARIAAITGSEEAKGREQLANHLAMETEMAADAAVDVLKNSPKAVKTDTKNNKSEFETAMQTGNNDLGPEGDQNNTTGEDADEVDAMFNTYDAVHKKAS